MSLAPPLTPGADLPRRLPAAGWAVLDRAGLTRLAGIGCEPLQRWPALWNELPPDRYLRDGGAYRRRRHGSFVVQGAQVTPLPQRAHWQPLQYNALHGGIERWYEPLPAALVADPAWGALLTGLARAAEMLRGPARWFCEAHPFRIDTTGGIGRPTPEGAHRDGVDLVAVLLVARQGVKGGETRVFEADGPAGQRFTLAEPWNALLLDDARMIHETTPVQPLQPGRPGWRDTLVLTYRRGAFLGPDHA